MDNKNGMPLLCFVLQGPMQSWGLQSRWEFRDTGLEPSKSGIIGLIGAAMGLKRGHKKIEELERNLIIGIREEIPGIRFMDFQTVHGAFPQADGKKKGDDYIQIVKKYYLSDTSFWVVLSSNKSDNNDLSLLNEIKNALENPKWPYFLGRKSCIPSRPLSPFVTTEYKSIEEALENLPWAPALPENENERKYFVKKLKSILQDFNIITEKDKKTDDKNNKIKDNKNEEEIILNLRTIIELKNPKDQIESREKYLHALQRQDRIRANPGRLYGIRYVKEIFKKIPVNNFF